MTRTTSGHVLTIPLLIVGIVLGIAVEPAGCIQRSQVKAMIKEILAAQESLMQLAPLTKTHGPFSMDEAYNIQAALAKQVAKRLGPHVGYKVAYASKAAQKQFGMDEPARGPFFLLQRVPSGSRLPAAMFKEIMLETEIAFTVGKRIDKPVPDVAALKPHVKWLHPAFDAGNFPYAADRGKPTPQDMIAIGTGAHVFVLGAAVDPRAVDIDGLDLALVRNGEEIRNSPARDVMGSPWNSLLWCANHVVKSGGTLEPGMIVLCGTAAPAYKVKGEAIKGRYVADCGALGQVTLTIE
jgi:2-keto-4-pentenoate hydratase